MSQIVAPSRRLWVPPQRQRGYVVLDAYRGGASSPGAGIHAKLRAYWKFDSDMLDSIGSYDITGGGTVTHPAGVVSSGMSNSGLALSSGSPPVLSTPSCSIGGWIKPRSESTPTTLLMGARNGSGGWNEAFGIVYDAGAFRALARTAQSAGAEYHAIGPFPAGGHAYASSRYWHVVARVMNGSLSLLLDGVRVAQTAIPGPPFSGSQFFFGYQWAGIYGHSYDECFASEALTDAEVEWLCNGGAGRSLSEIQSAAG